MTEYKQHSSTVFSAAKAKTIKMKHDKLDLKTRNYNFTNKETKRRMDEKNTISQKHTHKHRPSKRMRNE